MPLPVRASIPSWLDTFEPPPERKARNFTKPKPPPRFDFHQKPKPAAPIKMEIAPPAAPPAPKPPKEGAVCPQGHAMVAGNLKSHKAKGRRYFICRICYRITVNKRRALRRVEA